jgi:gas vesicle protein
MKGRIADTTRDYASQMKDRVSDAASAYADSVADFASDARQRVVERSARLKQQTQATLKSSMQRVLREQPLAVMMAGLAAGAAVAALFPTTEIEERALGGARQKLKETGEKMMDAAGRAGERLKSAAEERGLTSEGLKEVAGEVADTFKNAMSDKPEGGASPGSPGGLSGQNFGLDQSKGGASPGPSAGTGGRSVR